MNFSEWLRKNREGADMSQSELAKKVSELGKPLKYSITGAQVSSYEREYDRDQFGNPTRPKAIFAELAAQVLNRPKNEALIAARYLPDNLHLPEFLFRIDWKIFSEAELFAIEKFIGYLSVSRYKQALPAGDFLNEEDLKKLNAA